LLGAWCHWRSVLGVGVFVLRGACVVNQGRAAAAERIKRETDVHLRQLAKKSTYVPTFFLVRFWAFLGKGSSKTREKQLVRFKKNHRGFFFRVDFFTFFFRLILLRWLSASR
jgi:hypothetical protein